MSAPRLSPGVAEVLRLLPENRWVTPLGLASHAAIVGHTVTEDPQTPGEYLIGPQRLSSALRALKRASLARTEDGGTWVRTPTGSRHLELARA